MVIGGAEAVDGVLEGAQGNSLRGIDNKIDNFNLFSTQFIT